MLLLLLSVLRGILVLLLLSVHGVVLPVRLMVWVLVGENVLHGCGWLLVLLLFHVVSAVAHAARRRRKKVEFKVDSKLYGFKEVERK